MDFRMEIETIFNQIARKYDPGLQDITIENRDVLIKRLAEEDKGLSDSLRNLANAYITYDYLKSDKELRMKMRDIWEMQVKDTRFKLEMLIRKTKKNLTGLGLIG